MGMLKYIAQQGKDKAISLALEKLAQRYAERFGKVMNLKIDSKSREIRLEILLKGETEPVEIHVKHYEIISEEGRHFILAHDIDVSRQWMKALADEYIRAKPFEVPAKYMKMLEIIA
jgi:hypothetical protein